MSFVFRLGFDSQVMVYIGKFSEIQKKCEIRNPSGPKHFW
jgi:hypothetical protein